MSSHYTAPITLVANAAPDRWIGPAIKAGASSTHYLRVRDEASQERGSFVRRVFGDAACFAFSDEGTFALSRAHADYSILVLDVADPSRMARYLKANRALLRNVAVFAIMHESSPPRRSRMLVAGCDDVLDSARMTPDEARMRVAAVMRRYQAHRALWEADHRITADVARFAAPDILTPRELALLGALAGQPGKSMSVQQLCRLVAPPDPAQFRRALRFAISRLRSKLDPQWRIECTPDKGYALFRCDAGSRDTADNGEAGRRRSSARQRPAQDPRAPSFDQIRPAA